MASLKDKLFGKGNAFNTRLLVKKDKKESAPKAAKPKSTKKKMKEAKARPKSESVPTPTARPNKEGGDLAKKMTPVAVGLKGAENMAGEKKRRNMALNPSMDRHTTGIAATMNKRSGPSFRTHGGKVEKKSKLPLARRGGPAAKKFGSGY